MRQYCTPRTECDPRRQVFQRTNQDYKQKARRGTFKVKTQPKVCIFDEMAKSVREFPSPNKYNIEKQMGKTYSGKKQSWTATKNKNKRTYIDDIEDYERKQKPPAIGNYDLLKYTDIGKKKMSQLKLDKGIIKNNNFDNAICLAAEVPGPGQFNPHLSVKTLKMNNTNYKFFQQKHQKEEQLRRSKSARIAPNSYRPIATAFKTFDAIAVKKSKQPSRWAHGEIDIRKGRSADMKSPSPVDHNILNQWCRVKGRQQQLGQLNLLKKLTSAKSMSVYHN